jgi:glycosyltransferase involved in cell wall biosynthesis
MTATMRSWPRVYRVALLASHVIQYQAPFYRLLAAHPEIELTVLYGSRAGAETYHDSEMQTTLRWDLDLLDGYKHVFLRNFGRGEGWLRLVNPGILRQLLFGRYDAAILFLGWGTVTSLLAIAACRIRGLPVFVYGDSNEIPRRGGFAHALRRGLFALVDGFLVSGTTNADYYAHFGADRRRFFSVPWAIDNDRFANESRFGPGERETLRAQFGADDERFVIIYSAKLLPRKDPMTLLRAVDAMQHRDRTVVVFLGHGALRDELESFARERGLDARFPGFINQRELPRHYAMGDVFVLPSTYEPRGAVINEAMACGLPVIATSASGSAGDIVRHGENGFVFEAGDAAALAKQLDTLAGDRELRAHMAARSREIIATWDYAAGVRGILDALRSTC